VLARKKKSATVGGKKKGNSAYHAREGNASRKRYRRVPLALKREKRATKKKTSIRGSVIFRKHHAKMPEKKGNGYFSPPEKKKAGGSQGRQQHRKDSTEKKRGRQKEKQSSKGRIRALKTKAYAARHKEKISLISKNDSPPRRKRKRRFAGIKGNHTGRGRTRKCSRSIGKKNLHRHRAKGKKTGRAPSGPPHLQGEKALKAINAYDEGGEGKTEKKARRAKQKEGQSEAEGKNGCRSGKSISGQRGTDAREKRPDQKETAAKQRKWLSLSTTREKKEGRSPKKKTSRAGE